MKKRDLETKRIEYAQAEISEYWIVDLHDNSILVWTLDVDATECRESGNDCDGQTAVSILLSDFQVNVSALFDQRQAESLALQFEHESNAANTVRPPSNRCQSHEYCCGSFKGRTPR